MLGIFRKEFLCLFFCLVGSFPGVFRMTDGFLIEKKKEKRSSVKL